MMIQFIISLERNTSLTPNRYVIYDYKPTGLHKDVQFGMGSQRLLPQSKKERGLKEDIINMMRKIML